MSQCSSSLYQQAHELATTLPPLLRTADHTATRLMAGDHRRRSSGTGYEFWQFRPWEHGENAARIDWRQSARRDTPYIRQHEHTSTRVTWLWCADGPSMAWRSQPSLPEKREHAHLLTMTLACLVQKAGHTVGLLPSLRRTPDRGQQSLLEIASRLEKSPFDQDNSVPPPFDPQSGRYSTVILVGDFLLPLSTLAQTLGPLLETFSAMSCQGHLIQVLDPAEETLPFEGRVRLVAPGSTPDTECHVPSVADIRDTYRQCLNAHRDALRALTTKAGWTFTLHHTNQTLDTTLLSFYEHFMDNTSSRNGTHWREGRA